MNKSITESRAAQRFHQIAVLERHVMRKVKEVNDCVAHLKDLKEEYKGLLLRLRAAARDEGELPLFDLDGDE